MVFWLYDGVCGALLPLGLPMSRRAAETDWVVRVVGLEHTSVREPSTAVQLCI